MKSKITYILIIITLLIAGCKDEKDPIMSMLEISIDKAELKSEKSSIDVNITSNVRWTVNSENGWIACSEPYGEENKTITLTADENIYPGTRTDKVTISTVDGREVRTIDIIQSGRENTENTIHKLPVVFQVIYNDQNDNKQYIAESTLHEILSEVNELYHTAAPDFKIEFIPATVAPNGSRMAEPGVNRTHVDMKKINHSKFMGYTKFDAGTYKKIIWNPERYINICLYNFSDDNVSGIACMPYVYEGNTIPGLEVIPVGETVESIKFNYCVSINSSNIFNRKKEGVYRKADIAGTIAHELGHYMGLFHVFGENHKGWPTDKDTDHCEDTPTYNRKTYLKSISVYVKELTTLTKENMDFLTKRVNSLTKEEFTSENIMDYYYTWRNRFSSQQVERMEFVLNNSPFMPGADYRTKTKATGTSNTELRPITIECR